MSRLHKTRTITAVALAAAVVAPAAQANPAAGTQADIQAKAQECGRLYRSGDAVAAATCQQELKDQAMASVPEQYRQELKQGPQHKATGNPAGSTQPSPAPLYMQAQRCDRLSAAGDRDAAAACQQELLKKQLSGFPVPEHMHRQILQAQKQKAAEKKAKAKAREAHHATEAEHQSARDCTTATSDGLNEGGESYGYNVISNCRQPVTVHLCVADDPHQPSGKRQARLQPGQSVHWDFAKTSDYTPLAVYDACFKAEQCHPTPAPISCGGH